VRGRKKDLHNPVRTTIWVEKTDLEAAEATQLSKATIFRQGLKSCVLTQRTRPEVLERLAHAEEVMAESHEVEAEAHRHRAWEMREKVRNGGISGTIEFNQGRVLDE
jgi:hypothetical protein